MEGAKEEPEEKIFPDPAVIAEEFQDPVASRLICLLQRPLQGRGEDPLGAAIRSQRHQMETVEGLLEEGFKELSRLGA